MRAGAPPLVPVFRSRLQGELLALVLGEVRSEWTIDELAEGVGAPYQSVATEVRRLEASDLLHARVIGRSKLVRVNEEHPLVRPLRDLAVMAFGPPRVLAGELRGIEGCDAAYIYGSWAARHDGAPGAYPRDIDVLVLGDVDRDAVYAAIARAERRLHQEVNVTLRSSTAWKRADDGFARQVKGGPLVALDLA